MQLAHQLRLGWVRPQDWVSSSTVAPHADQFRRLGKRQARRITLLQRSQFVRQRADHRALIAQRIAHKTH